MGKYNYKIILSGNDSFHEIELKNEFEEGIVIGTTRFSKFRFPRDKFFCDFEISVKKENDTWTLTCSDDIYIDDSNTLKVYSKVCCV